MAIDGNKIYKVKNRGAGVVIYRIPEGNIRREINPGQTILVRYDELEKLSFQPGGYEMMLNFLQIQDPEAVQSLNMKTEPEYNMSEQDIVNLLLNGSLDQFLDTLDFAPTSVIDLIKVLAVSLPLNDLAKRAALKKKTGFDVDSAIKHVSEDKEEEDGKTEEARAMRRVQENLPGNRRTTVPEYKIIENK